MALSAALRNAGVSRVVTASVVSLSPSSWDLGPRQCLFGDNSALNKFNQLTSGHLKHLRKGRLWNESVTNYS